MHGRKFLLIFTFGLVFFMTACSGVAAGMPAIATKTAVVDYIAEGDKAFQEGHYEKAYSYFTQAINRQVDLGRAYSGRGSVFNVWRRYAEAANDFTKSLEFVRTPEVLGGRCIAYRFLALLDKAQADCAEALRLNPDSVDAIVATAMLDMEEKRTSDAETLLKDAIQKNPKSSLLVYSLAQIYLQQGNLDEAINSMSQAIQLDPNQAQYYCDRGFLYYSTAKIDLSKNDLKKAVEVGIEGKDDECVFKASSMLQTLSKNP